MKEKNIGFKITMARKLLGLSQIDLAKKLSLSRQTLSYWENGTAIPRIQQLEKLASVLKKDISYFLDDDTAFTKKISEKNNFLYPSTHFDINDIATHNKFLGADKVPPVAAIAHTGVVIFTDNSFLKGKVATQFTVKAAEDTANFKNGDKLIFDTKAAPHDGSLVLVLQDKIYKIAIYKKYLTGELIATAIFKSI